MSVFREFSRRSWIVLLMPLIGACAGSGGEHWTGGGAADRVELSAPDAAFPVEFSSIVGIREMSDGRLFVSDRLGQALVLVDMDEGIADTIGRTGGGPGEYSVPGDLFPWRGDSALMVDMGNTRFTPIGADGGFGISMPLMTRDGESMTLVMPEGTDRHGNVYFQARSFSMGPGGPGDAPDSSRIVRWNPETGASDTVAALRPPERKIQRSGGYAMMMPIPFGPLDDWAVSWDGRVGVARGVGYRVEWVDADGNTHIGEDIGYEPIVITQEDKDAWLETRASASSDGMYITMQAGGGGGAGDVRATAAPRGGGYAGPEIADEDWPEMKPPFPSSAVSATPEGELWVRRNTVHGAPPEYHVYDEGGNHVRTVVLAKDSRVVGFGDGVVYVARTDEVDLQWLERYSR